jgi:hypothetical protein
MMSVPHAADDPCPQVGTMCSQAGMLPVSTCGPDGKYSKICACVATSNP